MHVFDHHGIASVFSASVVQRLLSDNRLGTTMQARLDVINAALKRHHDTHIVASRMPPSRLSNIWLNSWADLAGPVKKAANTRHFMPFCENVCAQ